MTNIQILVKAITKAIDGGWLGLPNGFVGKNRWHYPDGDDLLKWSWDDDRLFFNDGEYDDYEEVHVNAVIFNHDFAKALWGDDSVRYEARKRHISGLGGGYDEVAVNEPGWKHHLQQMVIAPDPIKYLGDNI